MTLDSLAPEPVIEIRLATATDASGIAQLLADSFSEYRLLYTLEGFEATAIGAAEVADRLQEGPLWIAMRDTVIVGTVSVVRQSDSLYVRGMAVHPNARGRQIGEQLMEQAEHYGVRQGLRRLFLSTTPFLDRAISLYEKIGFRRIDTGPHDLFGTPLFTMEKILSVGP